MAWRELYECSCVSTCAGLNCSTRVPTPVCANIVPFRGSACNHFINREYEMRKIKLDVEDLCVDSFVTDLIQATRGTVNWHRPPGPTEYEGCESRESEG